MKYLILISFCFMSYVSQGADQDGCNHRGYDNMGEVFLASIESENLDLALGILQDCEIEPDLSTKTGKDTPLIIAIKKGYDELAIFLLDKGADVNHFGKKGTALMAATYDDDEGISDRINIISVLLERGASVHTEDISGHIALNYVIFRRHYDENTLIHHGVPGNLGLMFSMLLDAGSNPNTQNGRGVPILIDAIQLGAPSLVARLLNRGADPNVYFIPNLNFYESNLKRISALSYAKKRLDKVKKALEERRKWDDEPVSQHIRAVEDYTLIITMLLNAGADDTETDL